MPAQNPTPPYAMIPRETSDGRSTAAATPRFAVLVVVPYQRRRRHTHGREYRAGGRSIKQALEADRTDLRVVSGPRHAGRRRHRLRVPRPYWLTTRETTVPKKTYEVAGNTLAVTSPATPSKPN